MKENFKYIGKNLPLDHVAEKVNGSLCYAGDIQLPHMLYMKLLTSNVAHGIVRSVDAGEALAMPGVRTFLYYGNVKEIHYDQGRVRANEGATDQQTLFTDHVRFVGDCIGAIVAETVEIASKAIELIKVIIEPLPSYITVEQALSAKNGMGLHYNDEKVEDFKEFKRNIDLKPFNRTEFFESSSQRVTHLAMENHVAVADFKQGTGDITIWSPCQSVFGVRSIINTLFGISMNKIRAIKTPMGGSFGGKQEMIMEPYAAAGSIATGCPVKIMLTRAEEFTCSVLRHPVQSKMQIGFDKDYKIQDVNLDCVLDAGAYQTVSPDYASSLYLKLAWTYCIPHLKYHSTSICTNTPISGGFRGWGGPEEAFIVEEALNEASARFNIDPIDLRLKNLLPEGAESIILNYPIGHCKRKECLLIGKDKFGWEKRRKEAENTRNGRFVRGVGMAMSVHTSGQYPRKNDFSTVGIKLEEDGSVTINCNAHDHGCGSVTAFRKIAAETLGVPFEWVTVPQADTLYNWIDNGCYSSRSIYVTGKSINEASIELLEIIKRQAAVKLSCDISELNKSDDTSACLINNVTGEKCTYSEIAYYSADNGYGEISVKHTYRPKSNPGPAAADFAEVEIDTLTGECKVVDFLAVHDVGCVINPISCRSQVGSALQQSIGIVFSEKVEIDPVTGIIKNNSLKDYKPARAKDIPSAKVIFIEDPDEHGPFGAKSIGEAALVPVVPAILAAVNHALQSELHDLPVSKEAILQARKNQIDRSRS